MAQTRFAGLAGTALPTVGAVDEIVLVAADIAAVVETVEHVSALAVVAAVHSSGVGHCQLVLRSAVVVNGAVGDPDARAREVLALVELAGAESVAVGGLAAACRILLVLEYLAGVGFVPVDDPHAKTQVLVAPEGSAGAALVPVDGPTAGSRTLRALE